MSLVTTKIKPGRLLANDDGTPQTLVTISNWVLRLLIIVAGIWVFGSLMAKYAEVTIPFLIAILITAILQAPLRWLLNLGLPRVVAVIIIVLITIALFFGILTFIVYEISQDYDTLYDQLLDTTNKTQTWLTSGPLHLNQEQIDNFMNGTKDFITEHKNIITDQAISVVEALRDFSAGLVLCLFSLIFLLYDGHSIWTYCLKIVPERYRKQVHLSGAVGFRSLEHYGRTSVIVAAVDALGIGLGLFILRIPLAGALTAIVFIGAFVPILGALVAGFLAVFIALVTKGVLAAILVLVITIAVMQLESHVLQPFLMGKSVNIHPLAVVLLIGLGVSQAGIVGGLLVIPITAFANAFIKSWLQATRQSTTET